jgi:hypothetical protein
MMVNFSKWEWLINDKVVQTLYFLVVEIELNTFNSSAANRTNHVANVVKR